MKIVLQDGAKDCGVCCLLSIIRYYGGDVSKEYLREITNTTRNGVTAYNLIEGAKKVGFIAEGVFGDMTNIEDNNLPCLAHLSINSKYKHFVVVYKIDINNNRIIIMDPAKGKKVLTISEFKLQSTNNYIFLRPNKKIPLLLKRNIVRRTIRKIFLENKGLFILLIFLIFISFVFNVLAAFHFKYLLEFVINYQVFTNLETICIVLFILYLFKLCSCLFRNILFLKISNTIDERLTINAFRQILLLPYLYYKNRTTGEVISRLKDLSVVKDFLIKLSNILFTDFFSVVVFLIFLFNINFKLTLIILIFSVILFAFSGIITKIRRKKYVRLCKKSDICNSYLIESLSSADTIKGGHVEKRLVDKFLLLYKSFLEKSYLYLLSLEFCEFIKDNIKSLLLLVVYGVGCILILRQKMEVGDLFLYQTFLVYYMTGVSRMETLIDEYNNYLISLNRVEDLYTISSEKFLGSFYYYAYDLMGDIQFKNLFYKYSSKEILKGVNLVIKRGEKILLVGESGSGKSSLVKILMRYLEVPYGMCSICNIDINHYHLENIRNNISYVSCNEFLFTDSLYNNITLGREIDEKDFYSVVNITKVSDLVFAKGNDWHMMVEENGFNFSNGEKQRIVLSRYLLKNSSIYIFDEAFGQIDVGMEKDILKNVFSYLKDKTVIVISHRLNNKKLFDKVLKLDNGLIYEEKI